MTDKDDELVEPTVEGYMVVSDVGRAPLWYPWTIKLLLALTAVLAVGAFAAETFYLAFYLAPTARSNASALRSVTQRTEREKAQDACYDRYSADIIEGNARVLAALAEDSASIGVLVVLLAAQPRDPEAVHAAIERIGEAATQSLTASGEYDKAIRARDAYEAAGRPLPCTNDPN